MKSHSSLDGLRALLYRFYPMPAALVGYLFGILSALLSVAAVDTVYSPLPMKEALAEAAAAELPFWIAAALLAFIRPIRITGNVLVFLKAASCGFGAMTLLDGRQPSLIYFQYVVISLLITALYACLIRQATEIFVGNRDSKASVKQMVGDYLIRWLFYSGSTLLLLPLKYFTGF